MGAPISSTSGVRAAAFKDTRVHPNDPNTQKERSEPSKRADLNPYRKGSQHGGGGVRLLDAGGCVSVDFSTADVNPHLRILPTDQARTNSTGRTYVHIVLTVNDECTVQIH